MKNRAILGIGSNCDTKTENVKQAIIEIKEFVCISKHSSCYETDAIGIHKQEPYCNCVVIIETDLEYEDLKNGFKQMERNFGRTPESKEKGIIPLDIDIVTWNDTILKAGDMEQEYMKIGLKEICL